MEVGLLSSAEFHCTCRQNDLSNLDILLDVRLSCVVEQP